MANLFRVNSVRAGRALTDINKSQVYRDTISKDDMPRRLDSKDQYLYGGLIRLHILHHASKRPVFGVWFIEELARHGYKLSPGTLYPLLHGLEGKGYLRSFKERQGK